MAGINKVILIGNLGRDPEITTYESGVKRATVSVATTESYKDKEGNWVEQTEWHNVVLWRWLAERNLVKGDMVYIEGKLKTRTYDKDGVKHYFTEVIADKINRLTPRHEQGSYQAPPPATAENFQEPPPEEGPTDDLPF
ncbi:MAG: single-stranded DNA-binding protein [Bacteroidales bacterium]|jgi:single-strand DNA-binding protein|nr:single-stranded DNA-binding protein [Bacteroidales bacterium]NCU36979.1 single-stranded DNA-binding protein [Candidatus Falkowbacteria bacterium]MDD2631187.1 single-stranded DNA-binding protein [Bacteroidales bacterium]MDD4175535.1 single-stranded DNA-binding protein [Bacteroidales bacterium]MDD4742285.1 single-stranded DNA-binding protein [Bacteroidales bacterium]